ncbi:MAG TPA: 4'-phosphopantetheinyl transferase superfamily protein [Gemmatimonadales bacterium]|nr:4'-phosphopantetheinyl transferase superfamily protein [Gemmatimonadales bacterium]
MADGVGVDLEDLDALARFDGAADRLVRRWLDGPEQAWCRRQADPARAFVVVWGCREAAFKAGAGARSPDDVRLRLVGTLARGHGRALRGGRVTALLGWRATGRHMIAVAVGAAHTEPDLVDRLLSLAVEEDRDADSGYRRHRVHRHGPGEAPA